jgi:hypothetical protein
MNPEIKDKDVHVPIGYKEGSKNVYLFMQVPSLLLNDNYNVGGGKELILPLQAKSNSLTESTVKFFTQLDDFFYSKLEDIFRKLLLHHKNLLQNVKKVSYRKVVADYGDKTDVYKNGVLRFKLQSTDTFSTKVYDNNCKLVDKSNYNTNLVSGVYIKSIVELSELLIRGTDVRVVLKVHQLRVNDYRPEKVTLEDYSFMESESETESVEKEKLDIKYDMNNTQTDYLESEKPPVKNKPAVFLKETNSKEPNRQLNSSNLTELTHLSTLDSTTANSTTANNKRVNTNMRNSETEPKLKQNNIRGQSEKINNVTETYETESETVQNLLEEINSSSDSDTEDESIQNFINSIRK